MRLLQIQILVPLWSMLATVTLSPQHNILPLNTVTDISPVDSTEFVSLDASIKNNKVFVKWVIVKNEETDLFEVERNIADNKFIKVALIFSTENTGTEEYSFFERKNQPDLAYRVKVIHKNGTITYSPIIAIDKKGNTRKLPGKIIEG